MVAWKALRQRKTVVAAIEKKVDARVGNSEVLTIIVVLNWVP